MEPDVPPLEKVLNTFLRLSAEVSPERVIWRYDPIVLSNATNLEYHEARFRKIASALRGKTRRVVISLVDDYRGSRARLARLPKQGIYLRPCTPRDPDTARLLMTMAQVAGECGMEIVSCAEGLTLARFGVKPGKCIDDDYIARVFGIRVVGRKDPSQRATCGCVQSRDIGAYGTRRHGCLYCYATGTGASSQKHHDPASPSLAGG